jgi:CubicO group peptidase (beta-lactamase class C family)
MKTNLSQYFSTPAAKNAPEDLAQGYFYYKEKHHPVPYMDLDIVSGAGSVVSNILDYSKWLKALLNRSGPISKAGYKSLFSARTIVDPEGDHVTSTPYTGAQTYALGWFHSVYKGYEFFEHGGGVEAFGAEVIFFPALKYGLVSFGNTAITSNAAEARLIWHLIDEKLGIPHKERFDWNKK